METKTKTFDALEMSRRLREETSRELNAMSRAERVESLRQARERYAREYASRHPESAATPSS
jgi:hypothetical protein